MQLDIERGNLDFNPRTHQRYLIAFRQALGTEEVISQHIGRSPFYPGDDPSSGISRAPNMTTNSSHRSGVHPSPAYVDPSAIHLKSSQTALESEFSFSEELSMGQITAENTTKHLQHLPHAEKISSQTEETQYILDDAFVDNASRGPASTNNDCISQQYFWPDEDDVEPDAVAAKLSFEISIAEYPLGILSKEEIGDINRGLFMSGGKN